MPLPVYEFWIYLQAPILVGSGAAFVLGDSTDAPNDWDFIVNPLHWQRIVALVRVHKYVDSVTTNHRGGLNIVLNKTGTQCHLQLWPDTLEGYLRNLPFKNSFLLNNFMGFSPKPKITIT